MCEKVSKTERYGMEKKSATWEEMIGEKKPYPMDTCPAHAMLDTILQDPDKG